jgi:hypothetical protein
MQRERIRKSHPNGFRGWREATIAPTVLDVRVAASTSGTRRTSPPPTP